MVKKVLKRKFTVEDINKLDRYIRNNGVEFLVDIHTEPNRDDTVYSLDGVRNLQQAIDCTDKYFDNLAGYPHRDVELILREKNGEYLMLYHVEKNKTGLSYEALSYCK